MLNEKCFEIIRGAWDNVDIPASVKNQYDQALDHIETALASETKEAAKLREELDEKIAELDKVYQIENELNRMVAEQKEAIARLQQQNQRLLEQHDRVAKENKALNEVVDRHGGMVQELRQNVERATAHAREHAETCLALRKRNGKLAKKLERLRI